MRGGLETRYTYAPASKGCGRGLRSTAPGGPCVGGAKDSKRHETRLNISIFLSTDTRSAGGVEAR